MASNTLQNWTCPFCNRDQTGPLIAKWMQLDTLGSAYGSIRLRTKVKVCSNRDCLKICLSATLDQCEITDTGGFTVSRPNLASFDLIPTSIAKPQPEYIPLVLRQDYYEACSIERLSPKASATLSRRCLQGMIRDFCQISKRTLDAEIKELRSQVDGGVSPKGVEIDVMDAIDAVRKIGNIGAHMEADINVIIDIEPSEARTLIELVELLFVEWYVARHDRQQRIAKIGAIQAAKAAQKLLPPP